MLSFTCAVATDWLQNHGRKPDNPGRSRSILSAANVSLQMWYDNVRHHIVKTDPPRRRRCKLCNSQSVFICQKCQVHLHTSKVFSRVGQWYQVEVIWKFVAYYSITFLIYNRNIYTEDSLPYLLPILL